MADDELRAFVSGSPDFELFTTAAGVTKVRGVCPLHLPCCCWGRAALQLCCMDRWQMVVRCLVVRWLPGGGRRNAS
jgi:hypothetical protein|eukprot:COSAG01_NODE_506_length_16125_cov_5.130912_14_plen_76_part_00